MFSTQLESMNELKIELYNEQEGQKPKKMADCLVALSGLRAKKEDRQMIRFHQKMTPKGKITAEVTFFPRKNKIKRLQWNVREILFEEPGIIA